MLTFDSKNNLILWVASCIFIGRLILFIVFGPIYSPDSYGYIAFADLMLESDRWLSVEALDNGYGTGATTFRSIGYPSTIALFKLLAGASFDWALVAFQILFSLFASYMILVLARAVFRNNRLACFCAVAHAFGLGVVLDQSVLTDSLNTNLIIVIVCSIGIAIIAEAQPSLKNMLGLGCLLAIAFLIREAGAILQYLIWPIIIFWIFRFHRNWVKSIALFIAFTSPLFLASQTYKSWNEFRTGERFITTAGQTTMYFPALDIMKRGLDPFHGNKLLKDVPLTKQFVMTNAPNASIRVVSKYLHEVQGMNRVEMSRYGYQLYFELWRDFPKEMASQTLKNIRTKMAFLAVMPVESYITMVFWSNWDLDSRPYSGTKDMLRKVSEEGRYDLLLLYLLQSMSRLVSVVIFLAFVIGVPVSIVNRLRARSLFQKEVKANVTVLNGLLWVLFAGYTFAYALVHFELRYVLPVVPFGMIAGMFVLIDFRAYLKTKKLAKSA